MNVEDTVRDLWATRPHRPAEGRKVAGVAAAIGRRYAVDPVLVRVAFVVATLFSGAGILLYLLGWLLLPGEGDEVSAAESLLGRGRSSVSSGLTVVLGLALIAMGGIVFGNHAFGVLTLALAAGGLYLLHRSRAALGPAPAATTGTGTGTPAGTEPGNAEPPESAPPGSAPPGSGAAPGTTSAPGPAGEQRTPPAWDPLSAAPFAWDLPEPTPIPPQAAAPPRAPRSKVTPITLGLALLVGGIASALRPALSLTQIVALVLGVVGLGLVAGSLLRGGRGLIGIAVPLALLVWVLQAVPVSGFYVGEGRWDPVSAAQLQPHYDVTMGNGRLDLSRLRVPQGQTLRTGLAVGLGQAWVTLPRNVDAQLHCRAPVGTVDCLGALSSGIPAEASRRDDGPDGPGGGTLIVDLYAGTGNVIAVRGS